MGKLAWKVHILGHLLKMGLRTLEPWWVPFGQLRSAGLLCFVFLNKTFFQYFSLVFSLLAGCKIDAPDH